MKPAEGTTAATAHIEHPCGGFIRPIVTAESQFRHTVLHLLNPVERWDHLPGVPRELRRDACSAGCDATLLHAKYPDRREADDSCREHIAAQYRALYGPLYMNDLRAAVRSGQWGHSREDQRVSDSFVGEWGIFVIVRSAGVTALTAHYEVCTAYRVPPHGQGRTQYSQLQFKKAALRKLQDKTTYNPHESKSR